MSFTKKIKARSNRRMLRVRNKINSNPTVPKVCVFRSLNHIYAQIIDLAAGKTVASCSSLELKDLTGTKKEVSKSVGVELAKRAKKLGIEAVIFDRGSFLYHGRIKELAEGLRSGGIRV